MLAAKVLVRTRVLRRSATVKCASIVANTVSDNLGTVFPRQTAQNSPISRCFSSEDTPKQDDDGKEPLEGDLEPEMKPLNGELSPLEKLMQHSQQFRMEMNNDDDEDDDDGHGADDDDAVDQDNDQPRPSKFRPDSSVGAGFKRRERRRGDAWQSKVAKRVEQQLAQKSLDDLDFSELESVWGKRELKERKFHQALRREQDKDHVCQNCGEIGHRARNCLVPRICSNCGNLGHSSAACRLPRLSVDDYLEKEQRFRSKKKTRQKLQEELDKKKQVALNPRPAEVPVADFTKRNEQLYAELDAEIDEYVERYDRMMQNRKEKKDSGNDA